MSQIVYILKNESMPEYVKIGFTHGDVKERLKQLDRTGTPLPFEVYYAATVEEKDPLLTDRTGRTVEEIQAVFDKDKDMTSEEALRFGLVDAICKN